MAAELNTTAAADSTVTPWEVTGKVDYNKLIEQFGTELIDDNLLKRLEAIAKKRGIKLHHYFIRKIFFSHRQLEEILTACENGEPIFIYTGRGPTSDSLHLGHTVPFIMTVYLQQLFDCTVVIQISDDEKHWFKGTPFEDIYRLGFENAKDIIAFGFNPEKTFIFSNRDYRYSTPEYEQFMFEVSKFTKQNTIKQIFGFDTSATLAMYMWPIYQSIAAFSGAFPHIFNGQPANCIVVYAIDQDPYFRLARDIGAKMNLIKPCSVMSTFLDPLTGDGKMSSSIGADATIFLTDDEKTVRDKINKYAFSGGGGDGSLEQHRKYGGDPTVDTACKYLRYFEPDDDKVNKVCSEFKDGILTCGDTKKMLADAVVPFILEHQRKRNEVTPEIVENFYSKKHIDLKNNFSKEENEEQLTVSKILNSINANHVTTYHKSGFVVDKSFLTHVRGDICRAHLLEDDKMNYLFLTLHGEKINTKVMQKKLELPTLKFSSKEKFDSILKYGSPYELYSKSPETIKIIIDKDIENCKYVNFLALRDDALLSLPYSDFFNFLNVMNFYPIIYDKTTK